MIFVHYPRSTSFRSKSDTLILQDSDVFLSGTTEDALKILARRKDGVWTTPYFDCGRTNIWMVTFSAPIFGRDENELPVFEYDICAKNVLLYSY